MIIKFLLPYYLHALHQYLKPQQFFFPDVSNCPPRPDCAVLVTQVIGVPQPVLKWYKDGVELQPGDIHRIISGEDGTCCLGTYTCEAYNVMGSASSSASLLGFEGKVP